MNMSFGPTVVGIVDERIRKFTSLTKGIFFIVNFST
jgi:hypothetical protein